MTPARMAEIHATAFAGHGQIWPEVEIAAMLAHPLIRAVTLGQDGFALVQIIPPEAELLTIAITPTAQGKGHGRALLADVMAQARIAGATRLFLEVAADNHAALALYRSMQFTQTGQRRGYYQRPGGPAVDAITLGCDLSA
ncbi:GNAT family N-acetyltransferase [Roseicyclus sp.]|uniref:GNAT family N-acetyltransferase n=1 Tax=Roseicyclus sp. TaxID=1914329 RepID=UPI00260FBEF9|nr:GNAT family N-acetyltransferase [Roseicyclus sp.]